MLTLTTASSATVSHALPLEGSTVATYMHNPLQCEHLASGFEGSKLKELLERGVPLKHVACKLCKGNVNSKLMQS